MVTSLQRQVLKALRHPLRLKIMYGLSDEECRVSNIWSCPGIQQVIASQHLALLRHKKIIRVTWKVASITYSVVRPIAIKINELIKEGREFQNQERISNEKREV